MRRTLTGIAAATVAALSLVGGTAIAHKLSKGRAAQEAITWVDAFASVVAEQGPATWQAQEGAIGQCRRRSAHSVDCDIVLSIRDESSGERIACVTAIRVKYKNNHSRKVKSRPLGPIDCGPRKFNPPPTRQRK